MAKPDPRHEPVARIALRREATEPLAQQIYARVRREIVEGRLPSGTRLPSSRDWARALQVSRNTVRAAIDLLHADGLVAGRTGSGTYVARLGTRPTAGAAPTAARGRPARLSRRADVVPHVAAFPVSWGEGRAFQEMPALDQFPFKTWKKLVVRRLGTSLRDSLLPIDPRGLHALRAAVAAYLRARRSVDCDPEQVFITAGSMQALDLVTRVLLDPGDAVWIEDPTEIRVRTTLQLAGATLVPVPVDDQGLDVEAAIARAPGARLAFVSPSEQWPLGTALSAERRESLLAWARRSDAWIVEYDRGGEFAPAPPPLLAEAGTDGSGRVVLVGTLSRILLPSLRLGFIVAPRPMIEVLAGVRRYVDAHLEQTYQAAVADFIANGHLTRHVTNMSVLYSARGEALAQAVRQHAPVLEIRPNPSGLFRVVMLAPGLSDRAVTAAAATRGVHVEPLSPWYLGPRPRHGLLLCHTGYAEPVIAMLVAEVAAAARSMLTGEESR